MKIVCRLILFLSLLISFTFASQPISMNIVGYNFSPSQLCEKEIRIPHKKAVSFARCETSFKNQDDFFEALGFECWNSFTEARWQNSFGTFFEHKESTDSIFT